MTMPDAYQTPAPTSSGKVPFQSPANAGDTYETSYRIWGNLDPQHPPLICLHGGPGGTSSSMEIFYFLHQTYGIPVVIYDQLGCGGSTRLREKKGDTSFWTTELFISELKNLLEELNIPEYFLFGHSWGGMLATQYAFKQPKGLRKLIVCSSPPCTALRAQVTARQKAQLPEDVVATLKNCEESGDTDNPAYRRAMGEYMRRHHCRLHPTPEPITRTMAALREDNTVYSTMYGASPLSMTGPHKDYDARPRLHEITEKTVPGGVLLMNGKFDGAQDDVILPFFTNIRARVKWVRFAESSHSAFYEETDSFFLTLAGFLEAE